MKKNSYKKGLSLIDTIVATTILMIIVLGTVQYRYHAILEIRKAQDYLQAVEIAEIFCNGWKGVCGSDTYDPIKTLGSIMDITYSYESCEPDGYIVLGNYDINLSGKTIIATLSYKDIDKNLRELNISVSYPFGNVGNKTFTACMQFLAMVAFNPISSDNKIFKLTTYSYCID